MRVFRNGVTYDTVRSETGEQLMRQWIKRVKREHGEPSGMQVMPRMNEHGVQNGLSVELFYEHLEQPKEAA